MNGDILIFCTAAEKNGELYRRSVEEWRRQFDGHEDGIDFLCVSDGAFFQIAGVETVELRPALGRPSFDSSVFPGWKRSFAEGIMRGRHYDFLAHVENDVRILNMARFLSVARSPGIHSGFTKLYGFPESAIVVLNDKTTAERLAHYFAHRLHSDERAERVIEAVARPKYSLAGERCEGHPERIESGHDYIAQYDFHPPIR